jgi:hypothetical protein
MVAGVCRSIQRLRLPDGVATEEEVQAAALQFVRKVSGVQRPSTAHQEAFDRAVAEVAASSLRLLETLPRLRTRPAGQHA